MKRAKQFRLFSAIALLVMVGILGGLISCAAPAPTATPALTPTATPTVTATPTPTQPVRPIVLKFASDPQATHWIHVNERAGWFGPEVERRSGGRLKLDFYPGGVLAKAEDIYDAVASGIADIGWFATGLRPGRFPLSDFFSLPFFASSGAEAATYCTRLTPLVLREFPDTKVLNMQAYKGYAIAFKKPVKTLEDLKSLKIRSGGGAADRMIEAMGGVPVFLTGAECYSGLQTGVLDGITAAWATLMSYKWYEVAKYGVDVATIGSTNVIPMNKAKFESLPPDLQKVLTDVGAEWPKHFGATQDRMDTEAVKELTEKWGMQIYKLPPAEVERWKATVMPAWDKWVKDMEAKGLPAKQLLDEYNKIRKELGAAKWLHQRGSPAQSRST